MKTSFLFNQVDVFTNKAFNGNPVAVVLNADELTTNEMQKIANWINLSETTFVCTPEDKRADYKLRIFSPKNELPFAGHPTLGSAHAVLHNGLKLKNKNKLIQESKIGLIDILIEDDKLFFSVPKPSIKFIDKNTIDKIADALDIPANSIKVSRQINIGAVWITLQLASAQIVNDSVPDMQKLSFIIPEGVTGVTIFGSTLNSADTQFEVRSFAPNEGAPEDPVCGSGNGCVAIMVKEYNLTKGRNYVASQGSSLARDGKIEIKFIGSEKILLGGYSTTCIEGQLTF